MIKTWAYDVECLPNFFSIVFINVNSYLDIFKDACNIEIKKGKEKRTPIPLIQKYKVSEIQQRLKQVEKRSFYITDTDDSQLLPLLGFINNLRPYRNEKGVAVRNDVFGYNSNRYDKLMIAALLMYYNQLGSTKDLLLRLYGISKHIINSQDDDYNVVKNDYILNSLKQFAIPFINVDIMTIFALNKVGTGVNEKGETIYFGKSLKQTSINLQWYEILEYELPPITEKDAEYYRKQDNMKNFSLMELNRYVNKWDRYILPEWINPTMHYNANDVYIVCEMIRLFIDEIRLRYNIANAYEIDVLSSSRSNIADKMFIKFYSDFSGLSPKQWRGKQTVRTLMSLKKVIFPFIKFKTKELQDILEDMKKLTLTSIGKDGLQDALISAYNNGLLESNIKKDVEEVVNLNAQLIKQNKKATKKLEGINLKINNLIYTIATGGLHSKDTPRDLKSKLIYNDVSSTGEDVWSNITDDSYIYVHWDISSFYPSIMVVYKIAPAHLDEKVFVRLVDWIKTTRVSAKHSVEEFIDGIPKDVLAQVLKIVINSIYGKFGFEKGDLYDRMATLRVTINGQLMIMMLCEELELNGIEVMSANTDGIVVKLYKNKKEVFEQIANNWKSLTKLDADSEEYKEYINRDINNYICQEINGKLSFKGALNPHSYLDSLDKGYDMPIVAEAVYQFFINKVPILETLYNATNILDFCKTQNVNKSFDLYYSVGTTNTHIQRNTRFYVSNNGGTISKINPNGQASDLCSGQKVTVLNTLNDEDIRYRDICYQYYYNECYKIIDPILLGISPNVKADSIKKTISGKQLIKKYKGQYNSLFDDNY